MIKRLNRFKDLENLLKTLKHVIDNSVGLGVNLQVLTRFYLENLHHMRSYSKHEFNKAYMRLYRFLDALHSEGYVEIKKVDGLIWIKATDRAVDLIVYSRKTQTPRGTRKILETMKRLHEAKYTAREYVANKRSLDAKDYEYLYSLFEEYVDDTGCKVLVFKDPDGGIVLKRYTHRFQKRQLRRLREKFRNIFENASKRFHYGVFITLTMDPKTYSSILEGVRLRSKAWNRFMSFLRKRLGFRPPYVSVLEFQNSGNPHLHVVIFGVKRIADHRELTEYLVKQGFGMIHFEYEIVNHHGNWVWCGDKPKNSNVNNVANYLEKYLVKAVKGVYSSGSTNTGSSLSVDGSTNTGSSLSVDDYKVTLYWSTDARFFTYSRSLYQPIRLPKEFGWVFIGSYNVFEAPDWLWVHIEDMIHELGPPPWFT